ncbi:MAG: hypothetical protein WC850_06740 [Candidatus Gracilibacteria bacterium]
MKKILFTILILLLLVSCGTKKQETNKTEQILTKTGITNLKTDITKQADQKINTENFGAKIKEEHLKNTSSDVRKVFEELEQAKISKDIQKENELLKEINKLRETKMKELDEAVKNGDTEKAKQLRKEMMIFFSVMDKGFKF